MTAEIVAALKAGARPWVRPWRALENTGLPTNVVSGRCYSGVNVLLLQLVGQARGYQSKWWGTFNRWQSLGCHVMKRPALPTGENSVDGPARAGILARGASRMTCSAPTAEGFTWSSC